MSIYSLNYCLPMISVPWITDTAVSPFWWNPLDIHVLWLSIALSGVPKMHLIKFQIHTCTALHAHARTYIHVHLHMRIHTYMLAYIHIYTLTQKHSLIHTHLHTHIHPVTCMLANFRVLRLMFCYSGQTESAGIRCQGTSIWNESLACAQRRLCVGGNSETKSEWFNQVHR